MTPPITPHRCREILAQFGYFDHDKVFCVFSLTDEQCGLLNRVSQISGLEGAALLEWLLRRAIDDDEAISRELAERREAREESNATN